MARSSCASTAAMCTLTASARIAGMIFGKLMVTWDAGRMRNNYGLLMFMPVASTGGESGRLTYK